MSFYNGARVVFSPLLRLIFGIKRTGQEDLPKGGSVILCSNHRSNYDPVILGASVFRELKFMAKAELFKNPFLRLLITALGAFPVKRGTGDADAMKKAVAILKSGSVLAMFPEGTRQKTGGVPRRFHRGAAFLAYRTHASVVPAAIVTKGLVRPFRRNEVKIGKPIPYEQLGFTDGSYENLQEVSDKLHDAVEQLMRGKSGE